MLEKMNAPICVLVAFLEKTVMPLTFQWEKKKYPVDKINLVHSSRVGKDKWYYFSVSSENNFFKLAFNTENNKWFLQEVFYGS